jgi:hypothetical protein
VWQRIGPFLIATVREQRAALAEERFGAEGDARGHATRPRCVARPGATARTAKTGAPDDVVAMAAVDGIVVGGGLGAGH